MIRFLYVEEEVRDHPRVIEIRQRLPQAVVIEVERYQQVFNRRSQSFRLQKQQPALVLARKHDGHVLETPEGYGIGGARNYYFSHMLNCLYDCRYCFLQGMYRSAHMVVFVNYEDFGARIAEVAGENAVGGEASWFFSGYDCDSLAFDGVTGFTDHFLPVLEQTESAHLELRTKSVNVQPLLRSTPNSRCVVAYSLSPARTADQLEHGAPSLARRLGALRALQDAGWPIGLRFDPLIYSEDFRELYQAFFEEVFEAIDPSRVHSVSLGTFRLPPTFFRNVSRQYPDEPLFAGPLETQDSGMVSYRQDLADDLFGSCEELLLGHVGMDVYFPCLS